MIRSASKYAQSSRAGITPTILLPPDGTLRSHPPSGPKYERDVGAGVVMSLVIALIPGSPPGPS